MTAGLHQILSACCLWAWLAAPLTVLLADYSWARLDQLSHQSRPQTSDRLQDFLGLWFARSQKPAKCYVF